MLPSTAPSASEDDIWRRSTDLRAAARRYRQVCRRSYSSSWISSCRSHPTLAIMMSRPRSPSPQYCPHALAELEPERFGFWLPMLDEVTESCVALGTAGPKGCQLHAFGCAVPMNPGGLLDGLEPLGECPLNVARDGRDPERIVLLLKPNALAPPQLPSRRGPLCLLSVVPRCCPSLMQHCTSDESHRGRLDDLQCWTALHR
jgi:hypothetical protein